MENTSLTTKQLLERWKLLIEHKNDDLPVVLLKDATITYFDNNMAEIKKDGNKYYGMVPEDLSEDGKTIKVKVKFGTNIEEVIYNKNLNEDQNGKRTDFLPASKDPSGPRGSEASSVMTDGNAEILEYNDDSIFKVGEHTVHIIVK